MTDEKTQDEKNTNHEIIDKTDTTNDYQEKDILEDEAFKKSFADARLADKRRSTARASADKNNNKGTQTVKIEGPVNIVDIYMPFWSMVEFMVKLSIASIPAILILMVLFAIFSGFFLGILAIFN